jgi:4-amino-4-deoxychorismate lyase
MSPALGTWVDGVPATVIPADDRGLQYGDGLFETLRVRGRRARFLDLHLARLNSGCARLAIAMTDEDTLRAEIAMACAAAPAHAVLKIIVTRGSAVRRGYAPAGAEVARRVMSLWESAPIVESPHQGVALVMASGKLGDNPSLAGIKHLSRLEQVWAAREAQAAGAFDALMLGPDGRLVSGAMSNLFVVRSGSVLTPPVDRAGVAGIMRGVVLRECAALGLAAGEQALSMDDLLAADEVFVTNARIGVVPVRRVGEHSCRMNSIARRLADHIEALDA